MVVVRHGEGALTMDSIFELCLAVLGAHGVFRWLFSGVLLLFSINGKAIIVWGMNKFFERLFMRESISIENVIKIAANDERCDCDSKWRIFVLFDLKFGWYYAVSFKNSLSIDFDHFVSITVSEIVLVYC